METILIVFGVLIGIFILKFIYDSFLTENTDKRFEEYRKHDPIGAAEIETPKTEKDFYELVNALVAEESVKPKPTLADKFPEFVKIYGKNKTMTISSPEKLSFTNFGDSEDYSVGMEYDSVLNLYSLTSELYDKKENRRFKGENIILGKLNDITTKKINWLDFNDVLLSNVIITQTSFEFDSIKKAEATLLRFDGVYFGPVNEHNGLREVLRFYNDKTIINFRTDKPLEQVARYFDENLQNFHRGNYSIKNNIIVGKMNDRFTISFVTNDGKLFSRLYGRYDVSLDFYQFEDNSKISENKINLSTTPNSAYDYALKNMIEKEEFVDALLLIETYMEYYPSQRTRLENIKNEVEEKYHNSQEFKDMLERNKNSDLPF